jgi:uncharacterized membrane protein YhhN
VRPADRIDRTLAGLAIAAPALYLLFLGIRPYPGDAVLKTTMCALLALLALRHGKRLFASALLLSALGDALLAIDSTRLFVPALASFLVTHVLYAVWFVTSGTLQMSRLRGWRLALLVFVPLFAAFYTGVLWPQLGGLAIPVTCYIVAIVAMTVASLRMPATVVPIGAVSFMASDSLLALGKFLWQAPWIGPAIWVTYAAAQLLIAYGVLSAVASKRDDEVGTASSNANRS